MNDEPPPVTPGSPDPSPQMIYPSTIDRRAELLRRFLAASDERCPSCAYQLRHLTATTCPECGQALVLRIGQKHPNLAGYVIGLIGLAFPVGFGGIIMALLLLASMTYPPAFDMDALIIIFVITLFPALLLITWITLGRRIRRLDAPTRALLAGACWLIPALTVIMLIAIIFQ